MVTPKQQVVLMRIAMNYVKAHNENNIPVSAPLLNYTNRSNINVIITKEFLEIIINHTNIFSAFAIFEYIKSNTKFDPIKTDSILKYIYSKLHILNMQDMFDYFVNTYNIDVYDFNEFVNKLYINARLY